VPSHYDQNLDAILRRADSFFDTGRTQEAIREYMRALERFPDDANVLHHLGIALFRDGQIDASRQYLDRALQAAPNRADIWEHRGLLAAASGDLIVAEAIYHRALHLSEGTSTIHRNLADCLKLAGRPTEAKQHYVRALEIDPRSHEVLRKLGELCRERGESSEAAAYLSRAWMFDAGNLSDALELITALAKDAREADVDVLVAQLRARHATDAFALKELSFALNTILRFHAALDVARQGLAIDPDNAWLHHNACYACNMLGDFHAMRAHSITAASLLPDNAHMQFNLAATQLRFGEFERGWQQYRWHEQLPVNHDLFRPAFPEWKGESLAGRKFLLLGEQGLGDQIQFLRLADWLHRQGARVDVWVDRQLVDVAQYASGVDTAWDTLPSATYDFWGRMFRVPQHMRLDAEMLPVAMPYLIPPPELVHSWRDRTHVAGKKRIGFVWAGNPDYALDRYRSIPLGMFEPLLAQAGVRWYSLQKGPAQHECDRLKAVIDVDILGPEISSFSDTLAIVRSLDLVITIDTSVAHLAGACGCPVWVLLPTCTDWRWMVDRTDSPWYPTMRLFRQQQLGQWEPVMEDVRRALREWVASH
jgi:tetratricopeptide (TPR) repeat protein